MKKLFQTFATGIFFFTGTFSLFAQVPAPDFEVTLGGNSNDEMTSIQQTTDGGYILGGSSASGISGDKTQASQGGPDYWVVKLNSIGVKQWDARFGGSNLDALTSLQQTTDGGFILGGYSSSGISGDRTQPSQGGDDYWVVKINSNGVKQWDARFGGSNTDLLNSIQQTTDGGFILGGWSLSGISGDKTQASQGGEDYWVVKISSNGVKQWDVRFGGNSDERLFSIRQTANGGYILGGNSFSGISGDKTQASQGFSDYWVVKINSIGVKEWDARLGGSGSESMYSLEQTADGGYILGGFSDSGISGDKTQTSQGGNDYWVLKTDSNCVKVWDARFGGSASDELYSLQQTNDGGYLLGGKSMSNISGDKTQSSWGFEDYWVVRINGSGVKQWDARFGGSLSDWMFSLQQTTDGGYIPGGLSNSGISGDKTQASQGGSDYWVIKLEGLTTGTISSTLCAGVAVGIPYTANDTFNVGNIFTAQLSNAVGSFSAPVNIGTLTSTTSDTISATIPGGTPSGNGYRIRVVSDNPAVTGSDNGSNITINVTPTPTITGTLSYCSGSSTTLDLGSGYDTYLWSNGATSQTVICNYPISTSWAGTVTMLGCSGTSPSVSTTVIATGTWLGTTSSDWHTPSNWCGGVPASTTDVIIPSAAPFQPFLNAAGVCRDITIGNGAFLTVSGSNNLDVFGNWINNGTFIPGAGTVIFNGSGTQTIGGTTNPQTFKDMEFDGNGTIVFATATMEFYVEDFRYNLGTINAAATTIQVSGDWTNNGGTFNPGTGTVIFNGVTQQINGTAPLVTFNNMVCSSSGTLEGYVIEIDGKQCTINPGATFHLDSTTTLRVSGDWINNGGTFIPGNSTVIFDGSSAQTIGGSVTTHTFNNLQFEVASVKTIEGEVVATKNIVIGTGASLDVSSNNHNITLGGNWICNGTFVPHQATVTFSGGTDTSEIGGNAVTQTFNNLICAKPVKISGSFDGDLSNTTCNLSGSFDLGNATMRISGNWTNNGGTIIPGTSTVIFNGSTNSTIGGTSAIHYFHTLGFNKSSPVARVYLPDDIRAGDIISGSVGIIDAGTGTMYVSGDWTMNGGSFDPGTGTVEFKGNNDSHIYGTGILTFNIFVINKSLPAGKVICTSGMQIRAARKKLMTGEAAVLEFSVIGPNGIIESNGGTLSPGIGTISFDGTGPAVITGTTPLAMNHLTINNPAGLSISVDLTVTGVLDLQNGKISLGTNNLSLTSSASIIGANSSRYIVTNDTGALKQPVMNNNADVFYPVGSTINSYSPFRIRLSALSTPDNIKVRVKDGVTTPPGLFPILSRNILKTYFVKGDVPNQDQITVTLQWNAVDEGQDFDRNICAVGNYISSWEHQYEFSAATGSDPYTVTRNNLTSYAPLSVFSQVMNTSVTESALCAGASLNVTYDASGGMWGAGNVFTAQLSDASGSFASPTVIGSLISTTSGLISATIPGGTVPGTGYRIRVVSSAPSAIGIDNGTDIVVNPLPVITFTTSNVSCNGGNNGSATAIASGGAPAYNYLWSSGSTNATIGSLAPGSYPVTVTDANGCTKTSSVSITEPAAIAVSGSTVHLTCKGIPNGSISLTVTGGTPAYAYLWNNGSTIQNRSGLAKGTYVVTVTDANGCTKKTSFIISQPTTTLILNTSKINIRCYGGATGKAIVTPSGGMAPYSYSWNTIPVKTTTTISGLTAGLYSCTVTDANGCTKTVNITITQPAEIIIVQSQTNVSTNGGNDGSASVLVSGGTPPYTYYWNTSPVSTNASVSSLAAGTYICKITDSKGCVKKSTFIITQPPAREMMQLISEQLFVYPNPSGGIINLILQTEKEESYNFIINDISGKELVRQKGKAATGENKIIVDISHLAKGIYFLKLQSDRGVFIERLVLQ